MTALRNLIVLALLLVVIFSVRRWGGGAWLGQARIPLIVLGVLQLWLFLIALVLSPDPSDALREWIGEWFRASLVFLIGLASGRLLASEARVSRSLAAVAGVMIVLPLAVLALIHCAFAIKYYTPQSYTAIYFGPSDHRANITYVVALAMPVILADLYERLCSYRRLLPIPSWGSVVLLFLFLATVLTSSTRNGILVVVVFIGGWCAWVVLRLISAGRVRLGLMVSLLISSVVLGGMVFSNMLDSRWERLVDTVEVARDYEQHTAWYKFPEEPLPRTSSGNPVDESAYLRIVFAMEGTQLLMDNPWGTGLGRDAFKVLVARKYKGANVSHTHIGILGFALSAGLFGLAILIVFLVVLGRVGQREAAGGGMIGLVLLLTVCIFSLRTLIDNTLRDHILEQFMLVVGLLLATSVSTKGTGQRA